MVLPEGIEPATSPLPRGCSTTELRQLTGLNLVNKRRVFRHQSASTSTQQIQSPVGKPCDRVNKGRPHGGRVLAHQPGQKKRQHVEAAPRGQNAAAAVAGSCGRRGRPPVPSGGHPAAPLARVKPPIVEAPPKSETGHGAIDPSRFLDPDNHVALRAGELPGLDIRDAPHLRTPASNERLPRAPYSAAAMFGVASNGSPG